ncbi:MAG: hypothetical protein JWM44_1757 [Bacilli bacterium]|nr:hypothetical protein [Bacilli bacterium]
MVKKKILCFLLIAVLLLSMMSFVGGATVSAANAFYDFNNGSSAGWTAYGGNWAVVNGQYSVNSGQGNKSIITGSNYSSFTFEADVAVGAGGNSGLVFRASNLGVGTDAYSGYYVGLNTASNQVEFGKADNNWTAIFAYPYTVNANTFYHLKVVTKGKAIDIYVNTDHVISLVDTTFGSGSVGLRTFNTNAVFDNVKVTDNGVIADPTYDWSAIKGAVFVPTNAVNYIDMWQTFDTATIDRELGYAQTYGINTIGVYLHYLLWENDKAGYLNKIETFLQIANRHGIKTEFIFFDDCWDHNPQLGDQGAPIPGIHNSRWIESPGDNVKNNYFSTYKPKLKQYVQDVVNAHLNDQRIAFWENMNEPGCGVSGYAMDITQDLMNDARMWVKDTGTSLPQSSVFSGDKFSDFFSFHPYGSDYPGPYGPNVLNTESMNRGSQSVPGIVQNYGGRSTGYIMWEFGIGRTNTRFPWGSPLNAPEPTTPFHGIVYPDGHPWSVNDVVALNGPTANMPVYTVDYFNDNFTTLKKSSITPLIDFDLNTERGTASPDASAGVNETNYSIRWNGDIQPTITGTYTFYANSDNIARIWVNNVQIVNKTTVGRADASGTISLNAIQKAHVTVEYVHGTGSSNMHVTWSGPSLTRQVLRVLPSSGISRLESNNIIGNYIRHQNSQGKISNDFGINNALIADSQWKLVPGLANSGAVSFESLNYPGKFLRHRNGQIWLDANDGSGLFASDATWWIRPGLANSNGRSFESYNYAGEYIRHNNFILYRTAITNSLDQADATFNIR